MIVSSVWAGSLHPCAGHFIAEHYLWDGLEQETYSYYGPPNVLAFNVGYHTENHDAPSIPWTRLPALPALAPEFYDTIASHLYGLTSSYTAVKVEIRNNAFSTFCLLPVLLPPVVNWPYESRPVQITSPRHMPETANIQSLSASAIPGALV
ncbi:hypothetical protein FIBSPDRAFT_950067 [Athelia psychrophila]|uniref:Uncharacterized protein n=1 Tax=Athelia psychrophila TaxID=1759441 RepID=A0A166P2U2_9AGAM|nr:hypothetical protein FIBSPDRAFT_950067 [Fibularhizoctonia sp. CBS 109695]